MHLLQLPASLLLLLAAASLVLASPTTKVSAIYYTSSGSGSSYATACQSAWNAYSSLTSSWISKHATVKTQTALYGGTSVTDITYYANATTLCDGHPRVTASPAVPISNKTSTTTGPVTSTSIGLVTGYMGPLPGPSPVCSIAPSDCDGLWQSYSSAVTSYQSHAITAAPRTPICLNRTAAASASSFQSYFSGCGLCTIYGEGVELVYFPVPTTVSRDMCATTQSGSLTHYNPGDVLALHAGKSFGRELPNTANARTAVVDGHTFTSGTAYISISKLYAMNRCSETIGAVVDDAIIAMSSSAVLSLRYSQDHFQYIRSTDRQTGYPVSYADFNQPIPYSAWIGQTQCDGARDDYSCGIIYENNFRPQLAIPPGITGLNPNWTDCQVYFRGLYDPPLALDTVSTMAVPTIPFSPGRPTAEVTPNQYTPASPSNGPTTPHAPTTATDPVSTTAAADNEPAPSTSGPHRSDNGGVHDGRHRHHKQTVIVYHHQQQAEGKPVQAEAPGSETTTTFTIFEKTIVTVIQVAPTAPVYVEGPGISTTITAGLPGVTFTASGNEDEKVAMSAEAGGVVVDWDGSAVEGVQQSSDGQDDSPSSGSGSLDSPPSATDGSVGGSGSESGSASRASGPATGSTSSELPTQTVSGAIRTMELSPLVAALVVLHLVL